MLNVTFRRILVFVAILATSLSFQTVHAAATPNKRTFFEHLQADPSPGTIGTPTTFSAQLKYINPSNGRPRALGNKRVLFTVNGSTIGVDRTDNNGWAKAVWNIPLNMRPGNVRVCVQFPREYEYRACTRCGTYTIRR